MKTRDLNGAAWRAGLISIHRTDIDPPGAEAELRRLELLPEISKELKKSAEETRAVELSLDALNAVRLDLGLDGIGLDPDHIHVVCEFEFARRWGGARLAFTEAGHVYLPRTFMLLNFIQSLTHELVHLSSFKAIIDPALGKDRAIRYMSDGFSRISRPGGGGARRLFVGFDEGVTETIALEVRQRVAMSGILKPELAEILANDRSYESAVVLVQALIGLVGGDPTAARRRLFLDYFSRTGIFFRWLARTRPQALTLLKYADGPRDLLAAAEILGLTQAAERIKLLMNRRRRR